MNKNFILFETQKFAEIEIGGEVRSYSAETIPKPQLIEPVMDEKRKVFITMRQIAMEDQFRRIDHSKVLYNQAQRVELSKVFYKQAVFMKDFEDNYAEQVPFSRYYPYYQLMSYEQLRTYFTWRTDVRNGVIANTSLSYAFIYIYELLNNIGVNDCQEGLDKLMDFWQTFRVYDKSIDKHLLKWIKDYHVYYELPKSFKAFIYDNNIYMHYKDAFGYETDIGDSFELFCGISKYDIRHSTFYSDETSKLIGDCFCFVAGRLRQLFGSAGLNLDDLVFLPNNIKLVWMPFDGALFFPWFNQSDRRVALSEKEVYICRGNKWSCISEMESNRQLVGYIMKQMESALRKALRFKYKLSAASNMIDSATAKKLDVAGISLEKVINDAVMEFYADINKKVISIDENVLSKVRQEALDIQEKLIVEEVMNVIVESEPLQTVEEHIEESISDEWTSFKHSLTKTELNALSVILQSGDIKHFSDMNGVMMEVLIDVINQKAFDTINDTILDLGDSVTVYQEYEEKLMEAVMS